MEVFVKALNISFIIMYEIKNVSDNPLSLNFLYNHFFLLPECYLLAVDKVVRIIEEFVMITALNGSVILVS